MQCEVQREKDFEQTFREEVVAVGAGETAAREGVLYDVDQWKVADLKDSTK